MQNTHETQLPARPPAPNSAFPGCSPSGSAFGPRPASDLLEVVHGWRKPASDLSASWVSAPAPNLFEPYLKVATFVDPSSGVRQSHR